MLACYDPDNEEYQSICKIGTSFSDEELAKDTALFIGHVIEKSKTFYDQDQSYGQGRPGTRPRKSAWGSRGSSESEMTRKHEQ